MGSYKTKDVFYGDKFYAPEDLISLAHSLLASHNYDSVKDIAAHIFFAVIDSHDSELRSVGSELMRAAGSPCQMFKPDSNSEHATADYNRPSEPPGPKVPDGFLNMIDIDEEEWDDSLDNVFHIKLNPQKIKKAFESLTSTKLSEDKRRFVYYKVLVFIRWIPTDKRGSKKNFLKWWNLHFNCNWVETDTQDPFRFRVDQLLMNSQPYEWNEIALENASDYYNFAKTVKNTFTQTIINNVAQDGQDFNVGPLFDRGQFLKDTHNPINNGKIFFKV